MSDSATTLFQGTASKQDLDRTDPELGLSAGDATRRAQAGNSARREDDHGRSYADIVRQNMFTFLNIVLVVIGVVLISMHLWRDAFIATGLALLNGVVGMLQEIRAKRRLDSIALLYRVKARAIRDGREIALDPVEIVEGDLLVLGPGDQVLVDGVVATGKLECDESLLTGESDPVQKVSGDPIYSGSYCVTGTGRFIAEKVGSASLAQTIAAGARSYRMELTPLQRNVNTIIRLLLAIAGFYLAISLMGAAIWEYSPQRTALTSAVIIGIVPTGLFLMITVTYSLAAVRLANHDALIQQNNAVESLSNVDIFCMDKTGTLTANRIQLDSIRPIEGNEADIRTLLGTFAHSVSASNATSDAIASACPGSATGLADEVVFSSQRKWSAIAIGGDWTGVMALGAPEMLAPHFAHGTGGSAPEDWTNAGLRVLVFATTEGPYTLHDDRDEVCLPAELHPIAWIGFSDELRPQSRETMEGFQQAGITLKIISGDNADTVAALAKQAGLDPNARLISGPEMAGLDDAAFAQAAEEHTVFGRIAPDQKERIIGALRDRGHYVAMTGDGVNDVLSLKRANLGIAMQSGSQATRSAAAIVLLNDSFEALPFAFLEGQRIRRGLQGILELFLTRVFVVALILAGVASVQAAFPFSPSSLAIITTLTVGIPTFAMALFAADGAPPKRFFASLTMFVVPAALTMAVAGFVTYTLIYFMVDVDHHRAETSMVLASLTINQDDQIARDALTYFLVLGGLWLVAFAAPPTEWFAVINENTREWRPTLLAALMVPAYLLIASSATMRGFLDVKALSVRQYLLFAAISLVWAMILRAIWKYRLFERYFGLAPDTA